MFFICSCLLSFQRTDQAIGCPLPAAQQQLNKLTSIVLEPLLLSSELLAVQGQLLIRLMKEVPAVQARYVGYVSSRVGSEVGDCYTWQAGHSVAQS